MPLTLFSTVAYDVGWVDNYSPDRVPMIEAYEGHYVKALLAACLELATGWPARIVPGESIAFGNKFISLDADSRAAIQFPQRDEIDYISLVDFLKAGPRPEVKDKIVIIGLDTGAMARVHTPIGDVKAHRAFYYALLSLSRLVE